MHVVLVSPEIAPNTGNIIRLCANVGATLHLVRPLGFELDDRLLRRAGLDYHELATVEVHESVADARQRLADAGAHYGFSSEGHRRFTEVAFAGGDVLWFGAEQSGLDPALRTEFGSDLLTIPMVKGNRSLNLANAVAVVTYEAWRQHGFDGAADTPMPAEGEGLTAETPKTDPFDH